MGKGKGRGPGRPRVSKAHKKAVHSEFMHTYMLGYMRDYRQARKVAKLTAKAAKACDPDSWLDNGDKWLKAVQRARKFFKMTGSYEFDRNGKMVVIIRVGFRFYKKALEFYKKAQARQDVLDKKALELYKKSQAWIAYCEEVEAKQDKTS